MNNLVERSKDILQLNWKDGFTIPTSKLYPFQWNWDSGFCSLGHSHFHLDRAIREIEVLFSGQWQNGMLPHILFHSENEKTYFPNFDFWNSNINPGAPLFPKSSGITQPAVHGFVLETLLDRFPDNEKLISFAKEIFSKIIDSHRFLYTYRDPEGEGLMFMYHPWESGRDNSPLWDDSLQRISIDKATLPKYERRDITIAPTDERPTGDQYDRYVYLLKFGQQYKYDEREIFDHCPFLVQDTLMNAVLIKSNQSLIRIGQRFGFDTGEIAEWQQQAIPAFNEKLWNEDLKCYAPFDLRAGILMKHNEIGGISSLYAEIPSDDRAMHINNYLLSLHERDYFICPSFDVDSPLFDSKRYWRGPIWPQMNWMIYHGLQHYGFEKTADIVKNDLIELVSRHGFFEYFESQKEVAKTITKGYGGDNFSWTAACALDLFKEQ